MDSGYTSSGGVQKSSKKWLWITLAVILLLIIGATIAYFITKNNSTSTSSTNSSTSQSSTSTAKSFAPAVNSNQPYAATISTNVNGTQKSATMVSDGKGNYSYTYQAGGKTVSTVYTPDAYYVCNGSSQCIKYATSSTTASGFDPSTYQYDTAKIENLKNTAAYKGQQTCPGGNGTCEVWSVSSDSGNTTSTLYIDTATKRIAKATYSSGTTKSEVTYNYKDVHIAIPSSYTTAPTP